MASAGLQRLLSLARVRGCLPPEFNDGREQATMAAIQEASPQLHTLLAAVADKLSSPGNAAATTLEQQQQQQEHTGSADQAARDCLLEEQQRLEAARDAQRRRNAELAAQAQECYQQAAQQHIVVGSSAAAIAASLDPLQTDEPARLPLASVGVPEAVAAGGVQLLQSLAEFLGSAPGEGEAAATSEQEQQAQQREFERLQAAVQLSAGALVEQRVGVARAQAELACLQQQRAGGTATDAVLLGRSVGELEREVQHLQRKLEACLERTQAAAMQAAQQQAALAVTQQRAARIESARQRCAMKQQAVDLLVRHMARQLLVWELLRQERSVLGQVHALLQAASEDGAAVLRAAQQRRQELYPQQAPDLAPQQPSPELLQALTAALAVGSSTHSSGGSGEGSSSGDSSAAAENDGSSGAAVAADVPGAVAQQLLELRGSMLRLCEEVQSEVVGGQRAVFAQLHGLVFEGSDVRSPVLTAPPLQAKLAAAGTAASALQQAATAALVEVGVREQQWQRRGLREQVLVDFFTNPANLPKLEAQQRKALHS